MTDAPLPAYIGSYRVLGLLGEGGAGRVYLAEEIAPKREVALKVLREGRVGGEFQARFEREIALLGTLEHPGIARLYAAGTADTANGPLPYLAMEYVRGHDLMAHAEAQSLPLAAKLRLLSAICEAVHYAHTRGIVHRDLKPGNVLVDEAGQAKVLDFGIAHVTADGDATQVTRIGEVLGTLPYMSWEQLAAEPGALDPRADVFALGVMAYQLLSGQLPFAGGRGTSLMQALKERQERNAAPLSKLVPAAKGDLETIVMKAMAHEPSARYGSAAELAADLNRYLDRRPIEARPPTAAYVARLFVRRHKALAAGAALALGALVAAAVVSLSYGLAEAEARQQAELRLQEREAINGFLERMLTAADPANARGQQLTVRELLDGARASLNDDQGAPPAVRASFLQTLGVTYGKLGVPDAALQLLDQAYEARASAAPLPAREQAERALERTKVLYLTGRHAEGEQLAQQALSAIPSAEQGRWPVEWKLRSAIASAQIEQGKVDAAAALLPSLHRDAAAALGERHEVALEILQQRAAAARLKGDYKTAVQLVEQVVKGRTESLGADHPETLHSRNGLATHRARSGDLAGAETELRAVLADRIRVLGVDHSDVWRSQQNLAVVLLDAKKLDEGAALLRGLTEKFRGRYGPAHRETLRMMNNLATAERDLKNLAAGEALLREVIAIQSAGPANQHEDRYLAEVNLGLNLRDQKRYPESIAVLRSAVASARKGLPPEHPNHHVIRSSLGGGLLKAGRFAEARAELEPAYTGLVASLGPQHGRTRDVGKLLQETYEKLGLHDKANALRPPSVESVAGKS